MDVTRAIPSRLDDYADVFARSFQDDPVTTSPFPPGDGRAIARAMWMTFGPGAIDAGWLWAVEPAIGIAAWVPPDGVERYEEIDREGRDTLRPLTDDGGARLSALWDWIEEHLPDEPHWFLDLIAVAPERRGEGVGKALIELGLRFAERDGTCAFLETARPRNVGLYEHLGFRSVYSGDAPLGGPFLWFMRWDPA